MKNEEFERYFLKYKNLIIRLAMTKTKDYQIAQEICQQAYMALYANRDRVEPELVKAWLMRCALNASIDYLRRKKHRGEILVDTSFAEAGSILMEQTMEYHEDKWDKRDLTGRILREIKEVNEQWFEAMMLCCVEGLSCEEAAVKLNIPSTVLRARMHRARVYVRKKFGNEYP